jgi:hypothetical protein
MSEELTSTEREIEKEIRFDDFKVRCSAISKAQSNSRSNPQLTEKQAETLAKYRATLEIGNTLTEKQKLEMVGLIEKEENGAKVILSDTCIEYLMVEYAWRTEGMISVNREAMDLVAMKKGKEVEAMSGKLLSLVDDVEYKVHKPRIYNEYLSGEIDFYNGEHVMAATRIADNKASWDYPIFLKKLHTGLEGGQREQVQGYGDITGAKELYIANTLVDTPAEIIEEMKFRLAKKMGCVTTEDTEFLKEWATWEKSMKFTHIPIHKRAHKIKIEPFTTFEQEKLYDRVKVCREWLNNFHESYQKLNLQ